MLISRPPLDLFQPICKPTSPSVAAPPTFDFTLRYPPLPPVLTIVNAVVPAPVMVPPAKGSLVPILVDTVVLKLASSPKAAASSLSVLSAAGEESTRFEI